MRKIIYSGIVFLIAATVLVVSVFLAESYKHVFWWQVIGMAIVTFELGRHHMSLINEFKQQRKN
ncbi:hypothetical protein PT285_06420 [Lactobacillus sp. ESL0791]|uniref:hypothetical protein n=1 Tax=Lactobacillus sp. ESL0791 TaxID=2983234 RepID=UPI0023F71BB3|nr:hypothetical protein [Lactobacillus sp. ESL0791]MDF7639034.1 hypothetical protein [Lactobacillus sp. ESL0791]